MSTALRRAVGGQRPAGQDPDAVGDPSGQLQVVDRGQDRLARGGERDQSLGQVQLVADVEVGRRLVQENERGVLCERLRQGHALLLAAGQPGDGAVRQRGEVDGGQGGVDALAVRLGQALGPAEPRRPAQGDDLAGGKVHGQVGLLADERDLARARAARPVAHGAAGQLQRPGRRDQPGDGAQQRGLAGAVGAHQSDPLAGPDLERHVAQDRPLAQGDRQSVGTEQGGHAAGGRYVLEARSLSLCYAFPS